jgi:hypothetical protein
MMITFVKLMGPPILKAIRSLENISVDMPSVCIMDSLMANNLPDFAISDISGSRVGSYASHPDASSRADFTYQFFKGAGIAINRERCGNIISTSGVDLGEDDFYFEWFKEPDKDELLDFIERVDEALSQVGCLYSLRHERSR